MEHSTNITANSDQFSQISGISSCFFLFNWLRMNVSSWTWRLMCYIFNKQLISYTYITVHYPNFFFPIQLNGKIILSQINHDLIIFMTGIKQCILMIIPSLTNMKSLLSTPYHLDHWGIPTPDFERLALIFRQQLRNTVNQMMVFAHEGSNFTYCH